MIGKMIRKDLLITALITLLLFGSMAVPALAMEKYTFAYSTKPGEIIEYTGEVLTKVQVPWHEDVESDGSILYYLSTLTTKQDEKGEIFRLEDSTISLPNGEKISDQVAYRLLAPDFAYIDVPGGVLAGIDFFPPIPVSVGMKWTVTAELAVPYLNTIVPLTTTYYLQEVVPVGADEVAVIRQYTEVDGARVNYLNMEMNMALKASGSLFWSLKSGDYVGRYVLTEIVLELPAALGDGKMATTISRSEVVQSGNAFSEPAEKYIRLYLDELAVR